MFDPLICEATPSATSSPGSASGAERAGRADLSECPFCDHWFDQALLGRYGCPNCEGEGLDDELI